MTQTDRPTTAQIYLATPETFDPQTFPALLDAVLGAVPVACLRLALTSRDPDTITRAVDAVRELAQARDIAVVIDDHFRMVRPLGLDGVHLTDGARHMRAARAELGKDAIVGAFCGASRHDGLTAAEIGADYVAFGPLDDAGGLIGTGQSAEPDLIEWWAETIETPVVASGGLTGPVLAMVRDSADFVMLGDEVWAQDDPVAAIRALHAALG